MEPGPGAPVPEPGAPSGSLPPGAAVPPPEFVLIDDCLPDNAAGLNEADAARLMAGLLCPPIQMGG